MGSKRTSGNGAYAQMSDSLITLAKDAEVRFGADHPWTLASRDEAASKLAEEERFELAREYEKETLRRRLSMKESENSHEDEATCDNRMRLARHYSEADNSEDAIYQLRAALRALEAHDHMDWKRIVQARNDLVYELWVADQTETFHEVVKISTKTLDQAVPIFGADHERMIDCRYNLAKALASIDRFDEAANYFQENIGILEFMGAEERASRQLDEALSKSRDGLEECLTERSNLCGPENTTTQDVEPRGLSLGCASEYKQEPSNSNRLPYEAADPPMQLPLQKPPQADITEDQVEGNADSTCMDVDQQKAIKASTDELQTRAPPLLPHSAVTLAAQIQTNRPHPKGITSNGSGRSWKIDKLKNLFEGGPVLPEESSSRKSSTEANVLPDHRLEKKEGTVSFGVSNQQRRLKAKSEGLDTSLFEHNGSTSSAARPETSKKICVSTITPPDSPCNSKFPLNIDIEGHEITGDREISNQKAIFKIPGEWPLDTLDNNRSGNHHHTHSMSDMHSQVSKDWQNAVKYQPSRPSSAAEVEQTNRNWRVPNDESMSEIASHASDEFFKELEECTHRMLEKDSGNIEGIDHKEVKIAILDTGIAMQPLETEPEDVRNARGRIVPVKFPEQGLSPKEDVNGHGTHCAGILFKVCPYAKIYVYRVSEGIDVGLDPKVVAAAIRHAVSKRKVDVISMSFGWEEDNSEELREAIEDAKTKKVLMFAAASNKGGNIAFPARADEVIAIDAATKEGKPRKFNPRTTGCQERFTALGDHVLSAWPLFSGPESTCGRKRMSGTSAATAVAAATAALILEFARQPPLCLAPEVERHLKQVRGMRHVLRSAVCKKKDRHSDFTHIEITNLLRVNRLHPDGGDWHNFDSLRMDAAKKIVDSLSDEFGLDLVKIWGEKREKYMREHGPNG